MHEMLAIRCLTLPFASILLIHILYSLHGGTLQLKRRRSKKSEKKLIDIRWLMSGECIKIKISGRDAP